MKKAIIAIISRLTWHSKSSITERTLASCCLFSTRGGLGGAFPLSASPSLFQEFQGRLYKVLVSAQVLPHFEHLYLTTRLLPDHAPPA